VARGWARPRRSGCALIRSPAVTRPTMWAFVGNASTGPPFPWGLVSALSGYPQDPRSAGIDIDPHHLSFLDELEAIGVRGRIVFEVQVIVALHLRDDAPFDLAHGQVTPGPHLFPRTRLVAARLRRGGHGQASGNESGSDGKGDQLAHGGLVPMRKPLNKV